MSTFRFTVTSFRTQLTENIYRERGKLKISEHLIIDTQKTVAIFNYSVAINYSIVQVLSNVFSRLIILMILRT